MLRNPFKVRLKLTEEIESDFKVNLFRQNMAITCILRKNELKNGKYRHF